MHPLLPTDGWVYSNSQISQWMTCQALYRHQYIRKVYTRKRPLYFVVGSSVHAFIESLYQTWDEELAMKKADEVFNEVDTSIMSAEEVNDLEVQRAVALGMCSAYPGQYAGDKDRFQKFMPEKRHYITIDKDHISGPIYYQAIIDTLCQDAAGAWWLMEHKTPGKVNATYLERVRIDWQVLGQMHVAKDILGSFPTGVIYNVIKKPAIRLKSGETHRAFRIRIGKEYSNKKISEMKGYFTREEIMIGQNTLDQWLEQATHVMQTIATMRHEKTKFWPMNTSACTANYGTCAYLPACIDGKYNRLIYEKREKR